MDEVGNWAPRSPDLSAHGGYDDSAIPIHPQHQRYRGSISHIAPFSPNASRSPDAQQYPPYQQQQQQQATYQQQQPPPPPPQPTYQQQQQPTYFPPDQSPLHHYPQHLAHMALPQNIKYEAENNNNYNNDGEYLPDAPVKATPSRSKKAKTEQTYNGASTAPGVAEGIEVKTKFPVARIKRIMQADEDVGKVAQVTPVAVSKALELFMISLISKSATEAKLRGSKRVTAAHMKQAVLKAEQFDFLNEIVSKVTDAPAPSSGGGGGGGGKTEDEDEEGGAPTTGTKKRKSGGRKRKAKGEEE